MHRKLGCFGMGRWGLSFAERDTKTRLASSNSFPLFGSIADRSGGSCSEFGWSGWLSCRRSCWWCGDTCCACVKCSNVCCCCGCCSCCCCGCGCGCGCGCCCWLSFCPFARLGVSACQTNRLLAMRPLYSQRWI